MTSILNDEENGSENISEQNPEMPAFHPVLLNELSIQALPEAPRNDAPLIAICFAFAGALFILSGLVMPLQGPLLRGAGMGLMAALLVVLLANGVLRHGQIKELMQRLWPIVDELHGAREFLTGYLSNLDKRTSRYFHCVTNTKVTTYFMLRQIENSLNELLAELDAKLNWTSIKNYTLVQTRLKGDLEYRDGFEFNDGQLFKTSLTEIVPRIQELIQQLETGIEVLESEIKIVTARMLSPEEQRQLDLPFKG